MNDPKYDGLSEIDQGRISADALRGDRSDKVSTTVERRGDFPNTQGPISSEQRTVVTPLTDEQATALQEDEQSPDELGRYNDERRPETQSWKTTQDDDLPVDTSTTADD